MGIISRVRSAVDRYRNFDPERAYLEQATSMIDLEMRQREVDKGQVPPAQLAVLSRPKGKRPAAPRNLSRRRWRRDRRRRPIAGSRRTARGPYRSAAAANPRSPGVRLRNSRWSPRKVSVPASASSRIMSPSRILLIGPPSIASGVMWIAAGTLPEAPDIRPSVDQRHLEPPALQHAQRRRQIVQFRHADGLGAGEADHGDHVAIEFAGLERRLQALLAVEHLGRRLDHPVLGLDRRDLDHRLAEIAGEHALARRRPGTAR